ncbi:MULTISPECIES: type II CAAX prenyl endopeptidase Rce1 family protein [Haloferax]|uniref:CPBP family glutamic-type intramembrane protease n=1 Tax=Haloferax TaxID=2251 RepID=UPI00178498A3|nr:MULTISPECIES: CPBP family glutamic-type intramembrane protease [Haloferax]
MTNGSEETRVRATWRSLIPLGVGFGIQLLALAGLASTIRTLFEVAEFGPELRQMINLGLLGLVSAIGLLCAVVVARRLDERTLSGYGLGVSRIDRLDLLAGTVIGGLTYAVPTGVFLFTGDAELKRTLVSPVSAPRVVAVLAVAAIVTFGFQVTFEEFVFRSAMLTNFAEGLTARDVSDEAAVGAALLLSSLLFGVMHVVRQGGGGVEGRSVQIVLTSALLGLLWGGAYVLTGRLSVAVGLHFGHNVWAAVVLQPTGVTPTPPALGQVAYTASLYELTIGKVVVGAACLLTWVYLTRGELAIESDIAHWRAKSSGVAS